MNKLPKPIKGSIIYEDEYLYVCLANFPIAVGHTIVAWRDDVTDLHLLDRSQYEHLMDVVDQTRNAILAALDLEKVYLMYMDEVKHVHWHLVPRYNQMGVNVLNHDQVPLTDITPAAQIQRNWRSI